MNKLVKGAVATAAAAALLMGGAGTFAYWNSSVGVTGAQITAGNLVVADPGTAGSWTVQKNGTGDLLDVSNIATFKASPGDTLTYVKTVNVTATGDNLVATLSVSAASIVGAPNDTPSIRDTNDKFAAYLAKSSSVTLTPNGTTIKPGIVSGTYVIAPGSDGITALSIPVTVVINFPKDSVVTTAENDTKTGVADLSGLTVTLDQQH